MSDCPYPELIAFKFLITDRDEMFPLSVWIDGWASAWHRNLRRVKKRFRRALVRQKKMKHILAKPLSERWCTAAREFSPQKA